MIDALNHRIIVINKDCGPTSFEVVAAFRRAAGIRKVGHTGTLDPLASGVLVLCTGRATRAVEHFMDLEKEYQFTIRLGVETTTLDSEGDVVREVPCPDLDRDTVVEAVTSFAGEYRFTPPMYSALKYEGKRLYELARQGATAPVPERTVNIYSIELLDVNLPCISCRVCCSRGTYVRSLAADIGAKLGLPAHVTVLERTRIGDFRVEDAVPFARISSGDVGDIVSHGLEEALGFLPGVVLSSSSKKALMVGGLPENADVIRVEGALTAGSVRLVDESGALLAVGRRDENTPTALRPVDSFRLYVDNQA